MLHQENRHRRGVHFNESVHVFTCSGKIRKGGKR